jgi:hypothetical protein
VYAIFEKYVVEFIGKLPVSLEILKIMALGYTGQQNRNINCAHTKIDTGTQNQLPQPTATKVK